MYNSQPESVGFPAAHHGQQMPSEPCPAGCQRAMPYQGELARSYVVYQQLGTVFTPREAHEHATLFPELVRPYP